MNKNLITLDFEGVNWNATHWAEKSEKEFTSEALENGVYGEPYSKTQQKDLIAEAFKRIKAAAKTAPPKEKVNVVKKAAADSKIVRPDDVVSGPGAEAAEEPK
jgi:hypothetical protein